MITFRQHVVTIIAVFVALAVGVVLGGGLLADVDRDERTEPQANAEPAADEPGLDAAFVDAVSPGMLAGKLADQQVAVLTMPGADETVVTALTDDVTAAGGTVSGTYRITGTMTDPEQKSLVDTLGSQVLTQQPDAGAADASTYVRMGQLLAFATATADARPAPVSPKARGVREAVVGAELLEAPEDVESRAPLLLLVLGDEPVAEGGDAILTGLVEGMASRSLGLVVAGSGADGGEDGQLTALRAEPTVAAAASVAGVDVRAGRTAAILALARSVGADGGSFGASGADGAVPLG